MNRSGIEALLHQVASGSLDVAEATEALASMPANELGYATVDLHRALRTGVPEVVFGAGKSAEQIVGILGHLNDAGQAGLVTRVEPEKAAQVQALLPDVHHLPMPRLLHLPLGPAVAPDPAQPTIAVVTAGTSDLPVSEEAAVVAELFGNRVDRITDIGVAGIHRLLGKTDRLRSAAVVIVVAGMEGALASVVAGLVRSPVIAVPTSVGYGASFGGLAALLGMLNSCAAGVSVVNIDNGFGAAVQADRIARLLHPRST